MSDGEIQDTFIQLEEDILKRCYTNENLVILTEEIAFQLSSYEDQKQTVLPQIVNKKISSNIITTISSIDLGDCESILRATYNIPNSKPLIILKTDYQSQELSSTFVQYEILNPLDYSKLDLDVCKDEKITINSPITPETISLNDSLQEQGFSINENGNSDFYNNVCSTFTTKNNIDLSTYDRKKEISTKIALCQSGCQLVSYDEKTKTAACLCSTSSSEIETDVNEIEINEKKASNQYSSTAKAHSSFVVMKCYKSLFSDKRMKNNKGFLAMTILLVAYILSMLIYALFGSDKINETINDIMRKKKSAVRPKNDPRGSLEDPKEVNPNKDLIDDNQKQKKREKV